MIKPFFSPFTMYGDEISISCSHPDIRDRGAIVFYGHAHCSPFDTYNPSVGRAIAKTSAHINFLEYYRKTVLRPKKKTLEETLKALKRAKVDEKAIRIIKKMLLDNEKSLHEIHEQLKVLKFIREEVSGRMYYVGH